MKTEEIARRLAAATPGWHIVEDPPGHFDIFGDDGHVVLLCGIGQHDAQLGVLAPALAREVIALRKALLALGACS